MKQRRYVEILSMIVVLSHMHSAHAAFLVCGLNA